MAGKLLYDRTASVRIETATEVINIENLRFVFDVVKSNKKEANSCKVTVYNLSENTRGKIQDTDNKITVNAGYKDMADLLHIFTGNITSVGHAKEGADMATRIVAGDGIDALRNTTAVLSFEAGTSAKQVLKDLIAKFPLASKIINEKAITDKVFNNGFSESGMFKTVMDKIAKFLGINWTVQDDTLKIIRDEDVDDNELIQISAESGLIGSPEKIQNKASQKTLTDKRPRWRVTSLLIPYLTVGGRVEIVSVAIPEKSYFKVENIKHSGDTHGDEWQSTIEVVEA